MLFEPLSWEYIATFRSKQSLGTPTKLQACVLFALAYVSGPPTVGTDFQQTWPGSSQAQPFILCGAG